MRKPLAAITATGFVLMLGASALAQVAPAKAQFEPNSWYTEERKNADGTVTTKIHQKWSNYYENGEWKRIDLRPQKTANGFLVSKAPFTLVLPDFADGEVEFSATNRYDITQKRERNDPVLTKYKQFTGAAHVNGVQTSLGVEYLGALPVGDIVYQTDTDEFRALVRLNGVPEACKSDPNAEILIPFTETYSGGLRPKNRGANIGATRKDVGDGYSVALNEFRGMSTKRAKVWDSAVNEQRQNIAVRGRFSSGVFDAQKVLPCAFLLSATYPVFTDTTTTVRPDPNTEVSSVDGEVRTDGNATWAGARADTNGSSSNDSSTTMRVNSQCDPGPDHVITRTAILFYPNLGVGDTVISATLTLNNLAAQRVNGDNDGDDYIGLVASSPASNTALTTDDFEQFGTTLLSDTTYDITSLTANEAKTFPLNAAGLAVIGTTAKFGLREGHDIINSAIVCNTNNQAGFSTADTSGTASDPTLEITSTPGSSGGGQVIFFL